MCAAKSAPTNTSSALSTAWRQFLFEATAGSGRCCRGRMARGYAARASFSRSCGVLFSWMAHTVIWTTTCWWRRVNSFRSPHGVLPIAMSRTCTPRIETPHRLLLPPTFMLSGGGLMHFMVVKPLEAQLKQVIAEHNDSQTSKANAASENDQLRHKAGAVGQRGGWASEAGLL